MWQRSDFEGKEKRFSIPDPISGSKGADQHPVRVDIPQEASSESLPGNQTIDYSHVLGVPEGYGLTAWDSSTKGQWLEHTETISPFTSFLLQETVWQEDS